MALISDEKKFEREHEEREKAWLLLRAIPEYISDYKKSLRLNPLKNLKEVNRLKEKWGFFPLCEQESKHPSLEFLASFMNYAEDVSRFSRAVDFLGLEMFYLDSKGRLRDQEGDLCKCNDLLEEIDLKINLRRPTSVIVKELKEGLEHIRRVFDVQFQNTRMHDHLEYLVKLLLKNGFSKKAVHDRLTPPDKKALAYDHSKRESLRKRIDERITRARGKS